ncbi:MAG TPA: hypothetical protein PLS03_12915 [Terrimicrobiaceae bacterium]|nr:hypothetical protein [Terrimicrobiaceae bacterium]
MKFSITPSPTGTHVAKNGRRVNIVPAEVGKEYENEAAFLSAMGVQPHSLFVAKQTAISVLEIAHEKSLRDGIAPEGAAFALPAEVEWQNKFTGMVTLIQAALLAAPNKAAKDTILATPTVIMDRSGGIHPLTNQELLAILTDYGAKIQAMEVTLATKRAQIAHAASPEEIK